MYECIFIGMYVCITTYTPTCIHVRPRSFSEACFAPQCPPFVYLVPLSRTKPAFWISTRTAPGPISQVHPGCRVRHPQYSMRTQVKDWKDKAQQSTPSHSNDKPHHKPHDKPHDKPLHHTSDDHVSSSTSASPLPLGVSHIHRHRHTHRHYADNAAAVAEVLNVSVSSPVSECLKCVSVSSV